MAKKKGQASRFFAGALLVLLIVGLAGFGATNFGGRVTSVGKVGDTRIDVDRYARALTEELRALQAQTGQSISLSQAQQFGVDRLVLQRLVAAAALENETRRIGLSVGDKEVQRQLLSSPAFQGLDGKFDREGYEFALDRAGLSPAEYESSLRSESAANILQAAISNGIAVPDTYARVILDYIGERRNFSWTELDETALPTPLPEPTEEELRAWFEAHPDSFMLPPMKRLTYAWLSPEDVIDEITVDDAELQALYDERSDEYNSPERRLVERLVFGSAEEAQAAVEAMNAGEKTFEDIVAERGLALGDIDLGDVTRDSLGSAGDAVFAVPQPGIVGPVETDLGPALFRVNAILAARSTPFEEVRDTLRDEFAADAARRAVVDRIGELEDLLAGGATLEELSDEAGMRLGQLDWVDGQTEGGIAAYEEFIQAARAVTSEDFPEILELNDGGIFALRLDEEIPARPDSFENAREKVEREWRGNALAERLRTEADEIMKKLDGGASLSSLGLPVTVETQLTRNAFIEGAPAGMLEKVFALETGEAVVVEGDGTVVIAQLNDILPPDPEDPDLVATEKAIRDEIRQGLGQDALALFTRAVEQEAGISLDQAAINAVHAQFP